MRKWIGWGLEVLGRTLLYAALIGLCLLLSPESPIVFIYTEF